MSLFFEISHGLYVVSICIRGGNVLGIARRWEGRRRGRAAREKGGGRVGAGRCDVTDRCVARRASGSPRSR